MEEKNMGGKKVKAIRDQLSLSQVELAKLLGVSTSSVKNWETENGSCGKSSQILLLLLEKHPPMLRLIREVEETHSSKTLRLPSPDAIEGTQEWFELQRILSLLGEHPTTEILVAVYKIYGITQEWIELLFQKNWMKYSKGGTFAHLNLLGGIAIKLTAWKAWSKGNIWEKYEDVPLMTEKELLLFG